MAVKKKWMVLMTGEERKFPDIRFFFHYIEYFCMVFFAVFGLITIAADEGISLAIVAAVILTCVYTPIFYSMEKLGGMFHGRYMLSPKGIHYWYILPFSIIPVFRKGCICWKHVTQIELSYFVCEDGRSVITSVNCFFIHLQGGGERHITFRVKNYNTEKGIDVMIISFNEERYREFLRYYPEIIDERRNGLCLKE